MLHTFFRLMELEPTLIAADGEAVPTIRRLRPDVLLLDLDLPNLRALEIAREIGTAVPTIFLSEATAPRELAPVVRKPKRFEELLRLFEMVLDAEE
ncbi:MAG TPA: hypothetical protein VFN10_04170 [Thermoanaerobaculia bacterium]|nr:hypothetical protein [Thermoanaerobaculia bacterium]